jgi:DNA-binding beta-propeller fold protein YncE
MAQESSAIQEPSRIYVLSAGGGCQITTYTMDGKQTDPQIPIGGLDCTGMVMDAEGRLLVSIRSRGVVNFAPNGKGTLLVGCAGASALALDTEGRIHLLIEQDPENWLVRRYKSDGKAISGQLSIRMNNVSGIALDRSGRTFAVSQGDQLVRIFEPGGHQLFQTITTGNAPRAIAIGKDGKIYIANHLNVTSFLPDGKQFQPPLTHQNPETQGIDTPMALTVDAQGRLYVGYNTGYVGIVDAKTPRPAFIAREDIRGIAVR